MTDIFSNIEQQIENIDAKIEGIVKNATDSKNYEKLNQKINDLVNSSASAFEKGYERAEKVVKEQSEKFKTSYDMQQEKMRKHAEEEKVKRHKAKAHTDVSKKSINKDLFDKRDGAGGTALAIIGFILAGFLGLGILVLFVLSAIPVAGWALAFVNRFVLIPIFAIFLFMGIIGRFMIARVGRFKKYIQVLDGKMYADVNDFAMSVGKSDAFVRKDLKKMIVANWFKQGYLTQDEKTLIVSKVAYEEYKINQQRAFEVQYQEEQIRHMQEQLPVQARRTIQRGEDLIKEIHGHKVAISEYDMTIKLSHLETILKKIFKRVEKHPEVVPQMRKMMDYYLPTTVKLLEAYVQLDKQAIAGVNILAAKTEIEGSLDTLISAYEKLLDDLFEDIMLDVSTDIAVLNTMLAQDGLASDDFGNNNILTTNIPETNNIPENIDNRGAE